MSGSKKLSFLKQTFDILFDRAPCMMHMLNDVGTIVRVNPKWLETLGYTRGKVVGRRSVEFLTEESRQRAVKEILPHFWRAGSARSVECQFVASDLRRLPLLLDAEALTDGAGKHFSIAAIYPEDELSQWNGARNTLEALGALLGVQNQLQSLLANGSYEYPGSAMHTGQSQLGAATGPPLTSQVVGEMLERADDVSTSLRGLVRTQEERLDTATEQLQELLLEVRGLGRALRELVDVAAAHVGSEEKPGPR